MAYRFVFEMVMSEAAYTAVNRHNMNVSEIACDAVSAEIVAKQESDHALKLAREEELREENLRLKEQLFHKHAEELERILVRHG